MIVAVVDNLSYDNMYLGTFKPLQWSLQDTVHCLGN